MATPAAFATSRMVLRFDQTFSAASSGDQEETGTEVGGGLLGITMLLAPLLSSWPRKSSIFRIAPSQTSLSIEGDSIVLVSRIVKNGSRCSSLYNLLHP